MTVKIVVGDCIDVMRTMPDNSVHCCVTSSPYWGLRDYKIEPSVWGGARECRHAWGDEVLDRSRRSPGTQEGSLTGDGRYQAQACRFEIKSNFCVDCGAWRGALGLEPTPELFVEHLVEVFEEVRRVLRPDGTLWLNLGDSYATGAGQAGQSPGGGAQGEKWAGTVGKPREDVYHRGTKPRGRPAPGATSMAGEGKRRANRDGNHAGKHTGMTSVGPMTQPNRMPIPGLKPKDLVGIPWMAAFALRRAGWWLRQEVIWCLSGGTWLYARTASKVGPMMLKDLVRLAPETVELWNGERWTRVTAWARRKNRVGAREIVLRSGERIGCTDNHVWPTARGDIRTDEMVKGDLIQTARLPTGSLPAGWLTPEAFWFAGLYLAEGSMTGDTIQISGHVKEQSRLARLRDLVAHYGGSARAYNHKGNSQAIHIDSVALRAVLDTLLAGRVAKDKHLHPRAWHYRDWALKGIALGYLEGDGHVDGSRIRLGFCRNYALERDLRCLAARLGATLILKPSVSRNKQDAFPSFRGEWRWERSGHHNERDRGEVMEIRKSRARQFWDVTVADYPNLFALASGVLTHNSKPNPMPESTTDRCTKAHESIFLLTKSEHYFYDAVAIAEPASTDSHRRKPKVPGGWDQDPGHHGSFHRNGRAPAVSPKSAKHGLGIKANESFHEAGGDLTATRNKRSVWTVATQPFPEAHFATFPPALIEPCVQAGTSGRGCCVRCGAPWARVTTKGRSNESGSGRSGNLPEGKGGTNAQHAGTPDDVRNGPVITIRTLGWWPSCACDGFDALPRYHEKPERGDAIAENQWRAACRTVDDQRGKMCDAVKNHPFVPAVVLDPFGGAGTTALVADRLQRDALLIERNPGYAEMARRRIKADAGMFARAAE